MAHKLFDRHECFTSEMMTMTMDVIKATEDDSLTNMAYGLFDGYLYEDLLPRAIKLGVSKEIENKIRGLKKAIEMFIQVTSPTENI
jgi:hypothetical protein|tara:strand:- start:133 stop:390 length:258 start_codon:yes stop_codon:yes gene_type:complete